MGKYHQYLVGIRVNELTTLQILLSRYTISGIASMYEITQVDVLECATNLRWLRRAIFRLRDHAYHTVNGIMPQISYKTLHERENVLLGLAFVPE